MFCFGGSWDDGVGVDGTVLSVSEESDAVVEKDVLMLLDMSINEVSNVMSAEVGWVIVKVKERVIVRQNAVYSEKTAEV